MYFDAKEFGKRFHDVRTSRGITQEELAVRLGLASKQHVSRMENGEQHERCQRRKTLSPIF